MEQFVFKRFGVFQSPEVFKVGTDGTVLGLWCPIGQANTCLDIGTGTGLISLILAQRSQQLHITAIDRSATAAELAGKNFMESPWSHRLRSIHSCLRNFSPPKGNYDLLVSNPPFFENDLLPLSEIRRKSKHTGELSRIEFLGICRDLMHDESRLCLILPIREAQRTIDLLNDWQLALVRTCELIPRPGKDPNRLLMEICKDRSSTPLVEEKLVLYEGAGRQDYSEDFRKMAGDFYRFL